MSSVPAALRCRGRVDLEERDSKRPRQVLQSSTGTTSKSASCCRPAACVAPQRRFLSGLKEFSSVCPPSTSLDSSARCNERAHRFLPSSAACPPTPATSIAQVPVPAPEPAEEPQQRRQLPRLPDDMLKWLFDQEDPLAALAERLQDDPEWPHRPRREARQWGKLLHVAGFHTKWLPELRPLVLEAAALRQKELAAARATAHAVDQCAHVLHDAHAKRLPELRQEELAAARATAHEVPAASASAPVEAPQQSLDATAPAPARRGVVVPPPILWTLDTTGRDNGIFGFRWVVNGVWCHHPNWPGPKNPWPPPGARLI